MITNIVDLMKKAKELQKEYQTNDVGIYVSNDISIIVDGQGQDKDTKGKISYDLYKECLRKNIVYGNSLYSHKGRKYHNFNYINIMYEEKGLKK